MFHSMSLYWFVHCLIGVDVWENLVVSVEIGTLVSVLRGCVFGLPCKCECPIEIILCV